MAYLAQYTPRQRLRITLAALLLLALVAYFFSIRNTIELARQLEQQEERLASIQDAPQAIVQIQQQLAQIDQQLAQQSYDRNALFSKLSSFCEANELQLLELGQEHRTEKQQLTFVTNPIKVAGSYHNVLRLMYELEQQERMGYLVHSKLGMVRKGRSRKTELQADLYLQNILIHN